MNCYGTDLSGQSRFCKYPNGVVLGDTNCGTAFGFLLII